MQRGIFATAFAGMVAGGLATKVWGQAEFQEGFEAGSGTLPAAWTVHPDQPFDEVAWIFNDSTFVRNGNGSVKLVHENPDRDAHLYLREELPADQEKAWILEFFVKGRGSVKAGLYVYQGAPEERSFLKSIPLSGESGEAAISVENLDGNWMACRFRIPGGMLPAEATAIRPVIMADGTIYVDDLSILEEGAQHVEAKTSAARPNLVQVAKTSVAPQLDGKISPDEYPVSFTGLIDNKARGVYTRESRVGLGRDAERLYLAVEIQTPTGMSLASVAARRDDPSLIAASSGFFLVLRPDTDVERQGFEAAYLAVDPAGNFYDAWEAVNWETGVCQRDAGFQADWRIKTSTADGLYTVELSVPLRDLRIDPKAGEILGSFGFQLPETIVSWQMVGSWFDHPYAFGLLEFRDDAVAVRLDSVGAVNRGEVAPQFVLRNPKKSPVPFETQTQVSPPRMIGGEVTGWVFSDFKKGAETVGADKPIVQWSKEGELPSLGESRVGEKSQLKTPGFYVLENQVRINGSAVYYQKLPFRFSEPIVVVLSPFPSRNVVRARVALGGAAADEKGSLHITAKSPAGEVLWESERPLSGDDTELEIPLEPLRLGPNQLNFQLIAKDGSKASLRSETFTKRDIPPWLAKRSGIEALDPEWAPEPWGPVRVEDTTVTVWGRTFQFGAGALMKSVTSQGEELLRSPAVLKYRAGGKDLPVPLSAPRVESSHAGQVTMVQEAETAHFQLTARQRIEFDGVVAVELHVRGKGDVPVDAMWLEIALRVAELTTFVVREGTSGFAYEHGLFTLALPGINKPRLVANLWIGNERAGLSYFAESYQGWMIDSRKPRVEAREDGEGGGILKINFVNDPSVLPEDTTMRFGLQPSPFRPKIADFRKWRWGDRPDAPVNLWYTSGQMWTVNDIRYDPRSWKFLDELCATAKERNLRPLLYVCGFATSPWEWISRDLEFGVEYYEGKNYPKEMLVTDTAKSKLNEDFAYFQEDWNLRPRTAALFDPPTREQVFFSAGTSWADYAVYHIEELLKRTSIQALFFDISYPNTNFDAARGLAYRTKDGVSEGTTEFFAARDMWKRIYHVFGEHRGENSHPWILGHSFASTAPLSSFFDGAVNGEEIKPQGALDFGRMVSQDLLRGAPIAKPEKQFANGHGGAAYRAVFGPQFGPVNFILPQYAYLPELKTAENTRDVLAATFVHNSQLWNAYVESGMIYEFWNKVEVPFGMGDALFHGYWDNGITSSPEGIKVSYWKKPKSDDYLVAVANWTDRAAEAVVNLPPAILIAGEASDMESGQKVSLGKDFRVSVPGHDLRVFRIQAKEAVASNESKTN